MRTAALTLLALLPLSCAATQGTVEEITFTSQSFTIVGELRLPERAGPHPVVLFVHGDGPNSRTSGGGYLPLMERMRRAGYATFAWDKPGTGESIGEIDRSRMLDQRARIVLDAIEVMKTRPDIDAARIGVWGISQAGYVMPRVLDQSSDVAFMICVGCPGEPGVEQGAYLVAAQARCAGLPTDEVRTMERLLGALEWAETYERYVACKTALREIPAYLALAERGIPVGVQPRERWHEPNLAGDYFRDPMPAVARTGIPILAVFGEVDTQADPVQGAEAYRAALERGGNPLSRVEVFPGTDHNILRSETGCIAERQRRSRAEWRDYPGEYLDLLEAWLGEVRAGGGRPRGAGPANEPAATFALAPTGRPHGTVRPIDGREHDRTTDGLAARSSPPAGGPQLHAHGGGGPRTGHRSQSHRLLRVERRGAHVAAVSGRGPSGDRGSDALRS